MNSPDDERFTSKDVETWHRDGVALIKDFYTAEEIAAVRADFEAVFGRTSGSAEAMDRKKGDEIGRFNDAQFKTINSIPFDCSPALNLIGLHPALIAFARAALKTDEVHLYQCQAWAKFTGDADYDQPFHCDFVNHTLTVPSEDTTKNSVTVISYFTDVSDALGAMHYVTRPDSQTVTQAHGTLVYEREFQADLQKALMPLGRSSASPAGTAVPYAIDVFHRGTNLTEPGGVRYAVMACFKRADDDSIGYTAWPYHHLMPWGQIFNHATPDQLACLGVKRPGHPFWTESTLNAAQVRYPGWDLTPYRNALVSAGS